MIPSPRPPVNLVPALTVTIIENFTICIVMIKMVETARILRKDLNVKGHFFWVGRKTSSKELGNVCWGEGEGLATGNWKRYYLQDKNQKTKTEISKGGREEAGHDPMKKTKC